MTTSLPAAFRREAIPTEALGAWLARHPDASQEDVLTAVGAAFRRGAIPTEALGAWLARHPDASERDVRSMVRSTFDKEAIPTGAVLAWLTAHPGASTRQVRDNVTGKATSVSEALWSLVATGHIIVTSRRGRGGGYSFTLAD